MCDCNATLNATALETHKRVNYTLGLVLGVDEFQQEQSYFIERDRLHNRALHGYGTVHGLGVSVRDGADGPEVVVEPGLAVDPHGQHICVSLRQCAALNAWLNRASIKDEVGSPPGAISAYLTLCYREGATDKVPVPGGPCRSQEESMVASRIADDFELRLTLEAPPQVEESAIRRFGALLAQIEVTDAAPGLTEEELLDYVRALAEPGSPPDSPPSSPPGSPPELTLHPDTACDLLRAAFRVWVVEVRPTLLGPGCCGGAAPGDDCVLLAELRLNVAQNEAGELRVADVDASGTPDVEVVEDDRPYLLSTRLLQEWDTCEHKAGGTDDHGELGGLEDDDHEQYLHRDGIRPMAGTLDMDGNTITNLAVATANGEAMPHGQGAGGDLAGAYPNPRVVALQGRALAPMQNGSATAPGDGQVLTWNAGQNRWEPRNAPSGGPSEGLTLVEVAEQLPALPFVTIRAADATEDVPPNTYRLWFHLNAGRTLGEDNLPEMTREIGLAVFGETSNNSPAANPFLRRLNVEDIRQADRNVFFITLEPNAGEFSFLRFRFNARTTILQNGPDTLPLADWIARRPLKWLGHDGDQQITAFFENPPRRDQQLVPQVGYMPVAAGVFDGDGGNQSEPLNRLATRRLNETAYLLRFPGYNQEGNYIVTGTALLREPGGLSFSFEVVFPFTDEGIVVRVADRQGRPSRNGFMVQIFQIR